MNGELSWLKSLKEETYSFIQEMNEGKDFSRFKYSYSGDLYDSTAKWGLGQLVFAAKILYMIDKLKSVRPIYKKNLANAINSFQTEDGYYTDSTLFKPGKGLTAKLFKSRGLAAHEKIKRAETRQSFAALLSLNSLPRMPFAHIPYSKKGIGNYLKRLDWKKAWDAGSHFSHLLFFLHSNKELFGVHEKDSDELIDYAIEWANNLQSPHDGCWYKGKPAEFEKVNGAMKILTGLSAAGRKEFSYPELLIDTALNGVKHAGACENLNVVYTLSRCSGITGHRRGEIKDFCKEMLFNYRQYYHEDRGGFSFFKGKANETYYGAKISRGLNEPDIHGTMMFIWGISIMSKILEIDLDLKNPII